MNKFQEDMYKGLMSLVEETKNDKRPSFLYKDVDCKENENIFYRIFNYQIPRYLEFKKPYALSCRGTMYSINKETGEKKLIALPMNKFFGYGENDGTRNIKFEDIKEAHVKEDGSLITAYLTSNGNLGLKSKSEPVFFFIDLINDYLDENELLRESLTKLVEEGKSIDLEFTSPKTRVILDYKVSNLCILNVRDNETGETINFRSEEFKSAFPNIEEYFVKGMDLDLFKDLSEKNKLLNLRDVEGAVLTLKTGELVKMKSIWYMNQHNYVNIQDFSKAKKKLFHVVMSECTDELRTLLHFRNRSENFRLEDRLRLIDEAEEEITKKYGEFIHEVGGFLDKNKDLELSKFIELAKKDIPKNLMGVVISLYKGNIPSVREAFIRTYG